VVVTHFFTTKDGRVGQPRTSGCVECCFLMRVLTVAQICQFLPRKFKGCGERRIRTDFAVRVVILSRKPGRYRTIVFRGVSESCGCQFSALRKGSTACCERRNNFCILSWGSNDGNIGMV